jgi:hypothetical protein
MGDYGSVKSRSLSIFFDIAENSENWADNSSVLCNKFSWPSDPISVGVAEGPLEPDLELFTMFGEEI